MKPIKYPRPRSTIKLNSVIDAAMRNMNFLTRLNVPVTAIAFIRPRELYNDAVDEKLYQAKCRIKLRAQKLRDVALNQRRARELTA